MSCGCASESDEILIVTQTEVEVIETAAEQGPPGRPGPPGSAGGSALSLIAGAALGGHRAVRSQAGVVVYADNQDVSDATQVLGITQGAAASGAAVLVQTIGLMTEPTWSWTPDLPIFLGADGLLTQTPPSAGFVLTLGVALTPTQIHIGLRMPIVLE